MTCCGIERFLYVAIGRRRQLHSGIAIRTVETIWERRAVLHDADVIAATQRLPGLIVQDPPDLPTTQHLAGHPMIVEVRLARTNRQFISAAHLQRVRLIRTGYSPFHPLVVLVDSASGKAAEAAAGVIHQPR